MKWIAGTSGEIYRCRSDVDLYHRFGDTVFLGRNGPAAIQRTPDGLYSSDNLDELRKLEYLPTEADTLFDQVELCRNAFSWDPKEELTLLSSLVAKDAQILDAGCGWGRLMKPFAEKGFVVDGYDASYNCIQFCRTQRITPGRCHVAEFGELCSPDTYDLIYAAMNSARYCKDVAQFIRFLSSSARSLRDGGRLALQLTVNEAPPIFYRQSWDFLHAGKRFEIAFELLDYDLRKQICHDVVRLRQTGRNGEYAEIQRQLLVTRGFIDSALFQNPYFELEFITCGGRRVSSSSLPQGNYWFVLKRRSGHFHPDSARQ